VERRRSRVGFPLTVTEIMRDVWKEMRADGKYHVGGDGFTRILRAN